MVGQKRNKPKYVLRFGGFKIKQVEFIGDVFKQMTEQVILNIVNTRNYQEIRKSL